MFTITIKTPDGKTQTVKAEQFLLAASTDVPSSPNKYIYNCSQVFAYRVADTITHPIMEG